jgi:hypothetical protein
MTKAKKQTDSEPNPPLVAGAAVRRALWRAATAAAVNGSTGQRPGKPKNLPEVPAWTPDDVPTTPSPTGARKLTFSEWAEGKGLGSKALACMFDLNRATILELLANRRWPSAKTAMQIFESSEGQVQFWDAEALSQNIRPRLRRRKVSDLYNR